MQDSGLSAALAREHFAQMPLTALPCAISATFHLVIGGLAACSPAFGGCVRCHPHRNCPQVQTGMNWLSHFSRVTSSGRKYLPEIDGLRFVAIMMVVAYHVCGKWTDHLPVSQHALAGKRDLVSEVFGAGFLGVQLFFVISGFVLALPFAKQYLCHGPAQSLRAYFVRRVTRIEPPYVIHLCFLLVLSGIVLRRQPTFPEMYHNDAWAAYVLPHLLVSLSYLNGIIYGTHPYPNIVLWSLEVEVQFYLLAPFLARLFKISRASRRRAVMAGLLVVNSLIVYLIPLPYAIGWSVLGNLQNFLAGFLLCDFYLTRNLEGEDRSYGWDALSLLSCGIVGFFYHDAALGIALPWLALVFCAAAFRGVLCRQLLTRKGITIIGGMCYTIYMYHWLMLSLLLKLTGWLRTNILWLDLIIQFVLVSVGIIMVSSLLFVLFERPFMQRGWHIKLWAAARSLKDKLAFR